MTTASPARATPAPALAAVPAGALTAALLLATVAHGAGEEAASLRTVECPAGTCVAAELPPSLATAVESEPPTEAEWRRLFPVRTETSATADPPGPTLFGSYSRSGSRVVFQPRLPFLPGTPYVARLVPSALREPDGPAGRSLAEDEEEIHFRLPTPHREPPRVVEIHPVVEQVPENLLRAYVSFSAPMRPDVASSHVRLQDDDGRKIEMPFVEIDGGLWNHERTRLTLLFHPGRIKRGVAPREELGPPLREGRRYRLVVEPGWPSASGEPSSDGASRSWEAGPAVREPVVPSSWTVEPPGVGTLEPLRVTFGRPLDHALALRLLGVVRSGAPLAGHSRLESGQTTWVFESDAPWTDEPHAVTVDPALEDLAGNNLRGAFDRAPEEAEARAAEVGSRVPFRPRP